MQVYFSTDGQTGLPRYFREVFAKIKGMRCGRIDLVMPDGRRFRAEGSEPGPVAELHVHNPDFFARLLREGELSFGETYLEQWWSTPDLQALLDLVHADVALLEGFPTIRIVRFLERVRFFFYSNSKRQAKKNISYHYDLGNDFYRLWLDDTMTYSSALFHTGQESTEAAQTEKYARLVDEMGVQPGDHVLEIGCGWGGFAEYAARERGLKVTGLTISQEQHDYAVERIKAAGLEDQVDIKMCDYRDERGSYDGIVSIEMFEAVGERYWPTYFNALRERLKPGAKAALQIITIEDWRFDYYRRSIDFIQKFIFPGGMLPSPTVLRKEVEKAGLAVQDALTFGDSYSQTLRRWHETFNDRWDEISAMGFDDRFRRMWDFYLTSCAASFRYGVCDVVQITVKDPSAPKPT